MNLKKAAQKKLKKSGGFTLVEMLIVVAIIAILVAVSIPMVNANLEKARKATDDANLRAAKTVAMISAMESKLNGDGLPITGGATVYFYNVEKGEIVESKPNATADASSYGQSSAYKGEVIEITFATTTLEPTIQWSDDVT